MMLAILSKDIVVALHQLHSLPLDLVLPPIFYYKHEHTYVLDKTLFAQALAIVPHLSLDGLSGMVYEHFWGCFIPEDLWSWFLKLFHIVVVTRGDIPRSMALMLGANKLLLIAKDTNGLCFIVVSKVFFLFINRSIILQLWGPFRNTYPPISLDYRPLEAVRPSLLTSEPSLTYTLIGF
jgi:hypothetical protein